MTDHTVTVVDEYRRAFPWTARCSCGWEESYNAESVAARVAQEHEQRRRPTPPVTARSEEDGR